MHPSTTRNEFLRLRVSGVSLASIGRQLGVSKPTLIKWNRQAQSEIACQTATARQQTTHEAAISAADEIAPLNRKLPPVKQELFSRALREITTAHLEALAGELRQR